MTNLIDLTGMKFGNWTVIRRDGSDRHNYAKWLCLCVCGKEKTVQGTTLRSKESKSCGCCKPMPHGRLPEGESSFRALYRYTEYNAWYRNIEWGLDWDFFRWITKQPCHYCGAEPSQIYKPKRHNGEYVYNGVDRVDNEIGYFPDNCVPCCGYCNWMKSAAGVDDFRNWIVRVYDHWAKS